MVDRSGDDRCAEYREAIRLHVCAVCLDSRDDLSCGLVGRLCPIERHLETQRVNVEGTITATWGSPVCVRATPTPACSPA